MFGIVGTALALFVGGVVAAQPASAYANSVCNYGDVGIGISPYLTGGYTVVLPPKKCASQIGVSRVGTYVIGYGYTATVKVVETGAVSYLGPGTYRFGLTYGAIQMEAHRN
jgi:hypothetical protein